MNVNPRWVFLGTRMQPGQHGNLVGPIDLDSLRRFVERLSAYPPGARLMFTVELEPRERTLDQNAYYHGYIVTPLAEHLGWTHDEMHKYFKRELLGGRSTTTLSPSQFNEFNEECRAHAMLKHEFYLAGPNEVSVPAAVSE
jgi:hypothetical protein